MNTTTNKPTTIVNAREYLKGLRDNYKLDLALITKGTHPKVNLLSREEINLTLSSIDVSSPEGWKCAMATLQDIYWRNYRGYMEALKDLPYDPWMVPLFNFNRTLCEMLTDRLEAVKVGAIETDDDTTIDPKEITGNVKYADGTTRNGFGDWVCSLFGHNPEAASKGHKGTQA